MYKCLDCLQEFEILDPHFYKDLNSMPKQCCLCSSNKIEFLKNCDKCHRPYSLKLLKTITIEQQKFLVCNSCLNS